MTIYSQCTQLFKRLHKYDYCVSRKQHPSSHKGQKGLVLIPWIQSVQPTLISPLFLPLISFSAPKSFPRLHLQRSIQTLTAGYWFHLSHCINLPGTKQEVVGGHLDTAQSFAPLYFSLCLDLSFSHNCFSYRKLSL